MKKISVFLLLFLILFTNTAKAEEEISINKSNPYMYFFESINEGDTIEIDYLPGGTYNQARIVVLADGISHFSSYDSVAKKRQTIKYNFNKSYTNALLIVQPFGSTTHTVYDISWNGDSLSLNSPNPAPEDYPYIKGFLTGVSGTNSNGENVSSLTDRDIMTSYTVGSNRVTFKLTEPLAISAFYAQTTANTSAKITFLNSSGEVISTATTNSDDADRNYYSLADEVENVREIWVERSADKNLTMRGFEVYGAEQTKPEPIQKVKFTEVGSTDLTLEWENPKGADATKILLDGEVIRASQKGNTYRINNLKPITEYSISLVSINALGLESDPITVSETTKKPVIEDVTKLQAETESNKVDLSWNNPDVSTFEHVIIYRKIIEKTSMRDFFINVAYAADYEPIFETNGTYFNDLTVKPSTTYEYKLTTSNAGGIESEGVTVQATTKKETVPPVDGIEEEIDENGDYIYTWKQPTKGDVKVIVGGKEFSIVPASDGRIKIPAAVMKFKTFGDPDVQLIPISENGTEGGATDPNGGQIGGNKILPFAPDAVLSGTTALLAVVAPLIILWLVVWFARVRLIPLIKKTADQKKSLPNGRRST